MTMNTATTLAYPVESAARETATANNRRLALLCDSRIHETDVFHLFGWNDLPDALRNVIRMDMEAYRDELLGLYSTCDESVKNRRKSVSYWIRAYREGICSEETAVSALSASIGS
jgi:hypothetical protein